MFWREKMECNCKDWKNNLPRVNAGFALEAIHGGQGYTGKTFVYCPWCGKKLDEDKTSIEQQFEDESRAEMYEVDNPDER